MNEIGQGIPKNLTRAYMWYSIAAKNGDSEATDARNCIERKLTQMELEITKNLIIKCLGKKLMGC